MNKEYLHINDISDGVYDNSNETITNKTIIGNTDNGVVELTFIDCIFINDRVIDFTSCDFIQCEFKTFFKLKSDICKFYNCHFYHVETCMTDNRKLDFHNCHFADFDYSITANQIDYSDFDFYMNSLNMINCKFDNFHIDFSILD